MQSEKGKRGFGLQARAKVSGNQQVRQPINSPRSLHLVCIGDIHSQWSEEDEMALRNLKPDIALFVGDYGDEDTRVTRRIADFATAASFPVATVFGNHDAFFTASHSGRQRAPYDRKTTCRVTEQIEMLKDIDVSYRSVRFDNMPFSVCGGRAFSAGGPYWKYKDFFREFVGVHSLSHSTNKMIQAVANSESEAVTFLSHNGPIGLGSNPEDPCGKDWGDPTGGDFGDADLRFAIDEARNVGKRVPLVVFGHMHKALSRGRGYRTMVKAEADGTSGFETVMLNTAVFPRHKYDPHWQTSLHNFHIVQMGKTGQVDFVDEAWVTPGGEIHESTRIFSSRALSDATCTAMTGLPSASLN
ncbi:Calcineurin-like phosphoesterase [Gracilaria domingensis]|nr:Calcineurin-like phosphoesterase [Gracilaria domingensis]